MSFNADFLAKANKGYAAAQKALDDDLKKAEQPVESKPAFSFAPPPVKIESKAGVQFALVACRRARAF